ncbi:MAG: ABC transporter, partial [Thermoleophilia bacterium]|nr:ABC transporter [Thermoleophilia bacterium]
VLSIGINFLAGALMLVVFAGTGGALVGTEVVIAGGVAAAAHKLLIHVLGRETVAHLARRSRAMLDEQIEALLEDEVERFRERSESLVSDPDLAADLAPAVAELSGAAG